MTRNTVSAPTDIHGEISSQANSKIQKKKEKKKKKKKTAAAMATTGEENERKQQTNMFVHVDKKISFYLHADMNTFDSQKKECALVVRL